MTSHADTVPRTTKHQGGWQALPAVRMAQSSEPGFLALTSAMYRRTFLELGALATAPACARLHAGQLLWEWGLAALVDDGQAIVSELVTNALEATARHQLATPIRLRLSSNGRQVLIEVWDAAPSVPHLPVLDMNQLPLADAESGRGLFLVAALSERWGCYALSQSATGKVVWAEVVQ